VSQLGASSRQIVLADLPSTAAILVGVYPSAFKACQWLRCHLSSPNVVVNRGATLAADSIFLFFGEDERSAGYALLSTLRYCMNLRKDKHKAPGYLSSQTSPLELNGVIIDHVATQGRKAVMQASLPMLVWHSNSIKPIDSSNC